MLDQVTMNSSVAGQAVGSDMVSALAQCRQSVLKRATTLLTPADIPFTEQFDALPSVSALLMTSLEELKVAEEELRQQNNLLLQQRAAIDSRLEHYRRLFLHAPAAAFVTDAFGNIQEANLAAAALFRREANHLDGKPIQALLPSESREAFRRQLARLSAENTDVRDWRLVFQRVGDVPIPVSAAVHFVPGLGRTGSGVLYWMLRVADIAD